MSRQRYDRNNPRYDQALDQLVSYIEHIHSLAQRARTSSRAVMDELDDPNTNTQRLRGAVEEAAEDAHRCAAIAAELYQGLRTAQRRNGW